MYNILIVDDEDLEREALRMFLEKSNLPIDSIWEASNGKEAVQAVLRHDDIRIILLDINMPGLSGIDALEIIRESNKDVRVIISTAYSQFDYAVKALQLGAIDFLVKPVTEKILLDSIGKAINRLDEEDRLRKKQGVQLNEMMDYIREGMDRIAENNVKVDDTPQAVKDVCKYIEINYAEHIGLDDIVNATGYSKFHLNRIFKSVMNTTIIDYLIQYRIEKAKELLRFTREPVKNIALKVGYSDPNYFSWTFSKLENMSPLMYRSRESGKL